MDNIYHILYPLTINIFDRKHYINLTENTYHKKSPAGGNSNSIVTEKNPQSSRATSSTNVRKEQYR